MRIHKEGYNILIFATLLALSIAVLVFVFLGSIPFILISIPLLLSVAFLFRFFRVPKRDITFNENFVLAPADGTIVTIEEVIEDEFLNRKCIQVSIFMSVWNVHINWFPFKGKVKYFKYHPGKYLVARHPKSSTLNERTSVVAERNDGIEVMIRQIAGAVARRIVCYAKEGNEVEQCAQLGFIKFGSRVDLFLPLDSSIKVSINQKVTGTQTVIAEVPRRL